MSTDTTALALSMTPTPRSIQMTHYERLAIMRLAKENYWMTAPIFGLLGIRNRHQAQSEQERLEESAEVFHRIGSQYDLASLEDFEAKTPEQKAALAAVQQFSDDMGSRLADGTPLVLHGTIGCGKDHCLTALMRKAVFDHGAAIDWLSGWEFADLARAHATRGDQDARERLQRLARVKLFCLSDPSPVRGTMTPCVNEALFGVIDQRNRNRRPTWITVNALTRVEFNDALGAQVADRIVDSSVRVKFAWESYRANRTPDELARRHDFEAMAERDDDALVKGRLAEIQKAADAAKPSPVEVREMTAMIRNYKRGASV